MPFPLSTIPTISWRNVKGGRATYFGAPRTEINPKTGKPYPTHGACDLVAPAKTPVVAVADGTVWYFGLFYESYATDKDDKVTCHHQLYELTVIHHDADLNADYIARYGEISPVLAPEIAKGGKEIQVTAGQVIGYVGLNCAGEQMLHFEMFGDVSRRDSLSAPTAKVYQYVPRMDYQRRDDLLDPTLYLDYWAMKARQAQAA
jgi:murein DD-endopeptidase MepM/ murein hydrolase activator NlpD